MYLNSYVMQWVFFFCAFQLSVFNGNFMWVFPILSAVSSLNVHPRQWVGPHVNLTVTEGACLSPCHYARKPGIGCLLAFAEDQARGSWILLVWSDRLVLAFKHSQMALGIQLSSLLPEEMSHKSLTFKCGPFSWLPFIQLQIITGAGFWQQVADCNAHPKGGNRLKDNTLVTSYLHVSWI